MRILILEISATGHHPSYVRWILESEICRNSEVILAARREMFEHAELVDCTASFIRHPIDLDASMIAKLKDFSSLGLIRMSLAIGTLYRKICASLNAELPIDFVIVPYLDDCLFGLSLPHSAFGRIPWLAVTMRTMIHYADMGIHAPRQRFFAFRRWLFNRAIRQPTLSTVFTIDPTLKEFADRQDDIRMRKVVYLPDPSSLHRDLPDRSVARAGLVIPVDATVILLFGEISVRKGVICLLEACADAACSSRVHVILAGRAKEPTFLDTAAFQKLNAAGRIHRIDGYVQGETERLVIAAADVMWLGYVDFYGMSGVMVLSGRHGIPVIASNEGLIGHLTAKRRTGLALNPRDRPAVVGALNKFVDERDFGSRAGANGRSAYQEHDTTVFQSLVTDRVRMSFNLPGQTI